MKVLYILFAPLFILFISISGCLLLNSGTGRFNHKVHTYEGISCKRCHATAAEGVRAGMPEERVCVDCHADVDEGISIEGVYTLNEWQTAGESYLDVYDDVKFSHYAHINHLICSECHGNVANSKKIKTEHIPNAHTCTKCHSKWLKQELCSKCHIETRIDTPPHDHKRSDFMLVHGKRLNDRPFDNWEEGTGRHSHLCYKCHKQDHCIECHNDAAPRDHTNQWRLIGHGILAGIDRGRCKTCHKVDFCFRCHDEMRPRSHVANWGANRSMHCAYCHEPLSSTNCIVCHKSTPSHDSAPNAPDFVNESFRCRLCHFTVVPLDHFDNGVDCQNCHKVTTPAPARRIRRRR
ncbi:MAG: hypothetical protein ACUZ8H_04255 [Candidatus Anammoxibacter sp.]